MQTVTAATMNPGKFSRRLDRSAYGIIQSGNRKILEERLAQEVL